MANLLLDALSAVRANDPDWGGVIDVYGEEGAFTVTFGFEIVTRNDGAADWELYAELGILGV